MLQCTDGNQDIAAKPMPGFLFISTIVLDMSTMTWYTACSSIEHSQINCLAATHRTETDIQYRSTAPNRDTQRSETHYTPSTIR